MDKYFICLAWENDVAFVIVKKKKILLHIEKICIKRAKIFITHYF